MESNKIISYFKGKNETKIDIETLKNEIAQFLQLDKLPFAFIVLAHKKEKLNSEEIIESIKEVCRDSLPEYAQPIGYKILESLPLTNIGKVDYRALENLAVDISLE